MSNPMKKQSIYNAFKEEKELNLPSGVPYLLLGFFFLGLTILPFKVLIERETVAALPPVVVLAFLAVLCFAGINIIKPNEAMVYTFFGEYKGVVKKPGIFFRNPFWTPQSFKVRKSDLKVSAKNDPNSTQVDLDFLPQNRVSLKMMSLNNHKQKVNDALGNPIMIGSIVVWHIVNPTQAVFNVENLVQFLADQCDAAIRDIARLYPYDIFEELEDENHSEKAEKTLRGSAKEIAENMANLLQEKVALAGIHIDEVRITDLSYSEEIAAAMLQRQQAAAIIAARKKIVDGAVGMVQMALNELEKENTVVLDDERKAMMVSNLLVVLCGNKEAQPVVNSGSLY